MNQPGTLHLVVEDDLSEAVARKLARQACPSFQVGSCYGKGGFGYLKSHAIHFNRAAKLVPYLMVTDLDLRSCAPELIRQWLPMGCHPNLIFRVAVREIEAWVMADRAAFAGFWAFLPTSFRRRSMRYLIPNSS